MTETSNPTETVPPVVPDPAGRRWSPPLIAALVLSAALVVGVAVVGIVARGADSQGASPTPAPVTNTGPVPLVPVDAPQAGSAQCTALLRSLPNTLSNAGDPLHRRQLMNPAPPATAAWSGKTGDPVVLRCGIERPPELTVKAHVLGVSGVEWLQVTGTDAVTWYAVDRPVVIALTLPGDLSTGPLQDMSAIISAAMPAVPITFPSS